MPKEIEHKFLVRADALPRPLVKGKKLEQGYISCFPVVRVRIVSGRGTKAFLTIKGSGIRSRDEFEYPIPVRHARQLMKLCGECTLKKIRRRYGRWEVDEFLGRHRGLWLAEYELRHKKERLPALPKWIAREVTGDPRYSNSRLASAERK